MCDGDGDDSVARSQRLSNANENRGESRSQQPETLALHSECRKSNYNVSQFDVKWCFVVFAFVVAIDAVAADVADSPADDDARLLLKWIN